MVHTQLKQKETDKGTEQVLSLTQAAGFRSARRYSNVMSQQIKLERPCALGGYSFLPFCFPLLSTPLFYLVQAVSVAVCHCLFIFSLGTFHPLSACCCLWFWFLDSCTSLLSVMVCSLGLAERFAASSSQASHFHRKKVHSGSQGKTFTVTNSKHSQSRRFDCEKKSMQLIPQVAFIFDKFAYRLESNAR